MVGKDRDVMTKYEDVVAKFKDIDYFLGLCMNSCMTVFLGLCIRM